MCCEDVKIDYAKHAIGRLFAVTNGSLELFAADPYRWSITVSPPPSGTLTVIPDAVASNNSGILLTNNMLPITFDRYHHGNLVGKAWFAIHSAGGVNIFVAETFLTPDNPCGDFYHAIERYIDPTANRGQFDRSTPIGRAIAGY
jgi:hypothetical protein